MSDEKDCSCRDHLKGSMSEKEAVKAMESLFGWVLMEKNGRLSLEKRYFFEDFKNGVVFCHYIADLAAQENHHPVLQVSRTEVLIHWQTEHCQGLTDQDFKMAQYCDALLESITTCEPEQNEA